MDLEQALQEFQKEMLSKFKRRAERHPEDDVVVNGVRRLRGQDIVGHLYAEVQEWMQSPSLSESVDVANMAFLAWWLCKERGTRSLTEVGNG